MALEAAAEEMSMPLDITGGQIAAFGQQLKTGFSAYLETQSTEGFSPESGILAETMLPAMAQEYWTTLQNSLGIMPEEPVSKLMWIFVPDPARTLSVVTDAVLALDRYTGSFDHLLQLHDIQGGETLQVSAAEMTRTAHTLGKLFAHHLLAMRELSKVKPHVGELGKSREELLETSENTLHLLDTILGQFMPHP